MKKNLYLLPLLLSILMITGCEGGGVHVDTSPVGVGLAAIAAAMLLSSFVKGGN